MPVTITALRTAAITAISAACAASALAQMEALSAAGVTGKAPANASAVSPRASEITATPSRRSAIRSGGMVVIET